MRVSVPSFAGMKPRVGAKYLEENFATYASDCRLYSGELRPLRTQLAISTLPKPGPIKTLHLFAREFWFHWDKDVDVVRTLVPNDTTERTFWTGDGAPKQTQAGMATAGGTSYPMNHYLLGIPAPTAAPSVSAPAANPETETETRYYVYTYVSAWGEESAPSPPSAKLVCDVDATVTLSGMLTGPTGAYNLQSKRIYRLATGTDESEFFFVAEIPLANAGYVDTVPAANLAEPLETEGWLPPPTGLKGLTALANGVMCGFVGKDVYFTPPYVPYAWPRAYMVSCEYEIVGLAAYGTNAVVLTEGHPYLASGIDPSAITLSKVEVPQACVSKRSIANFGAAGVMYATPDGLAVVGGEGFEMVSEPFMTQEEWRAYNPSSILGVAHDGRYIGFFERENLTKGGFIFDKDNGFRELSFHATAAKTDLLTDTLYLCDNKALTSYDRGASALPYTWRSKVFELRPMSFSMARVVGGFGAGLTLNLKVTADGATVFNGAVTSPNHFRLASVGLAREWQVEVTGTVPLQEISLATSSEELRG
jgi:hypothetical protein